MLEPDAAMLPRHQDPVRVENVRHFTDHALAGLSKQQLSVKMPPALPDTSRQAAGMDHASNEDAAVEEATLLPACAEPCEREGCLITVESKVSSKRPSRHREVSRKPRAACRRT